MKVRCGSLWTGSLSSRAIWLRDGTNDNRSWNSGIEGPTEDPAVEGLRNRQVKNFLTLTMLSLGVPMILMGDEGKRMVATTTLTARTMKRAGSIGGYLISTQMSIDL